jgi:hypothetical protein
MCTFVFSFFSFLFFLPFLSWNDLYFFVHTDHSFRSSMRTIEILLFFFFLLSSTYCTVGKDDILYRLLFRLAEFEYKGCTELLTFSFLYLSPCVA